jgi:hypothetical protein
MLNNRKIGSQGDNQSENIHTSFDIQAPATGELIRLRGSSSALQHSNRRHRFGSQVLSETNISPAKNNVMESSKVESADHE